MTNDYEIRGDITFIIMVRKDKTVVKTMIDTVDLEKVMSITGKWYPKYCHGVDSYYVMASKKTRLRIKPIMFHRILFDDIPKGMVVDHINHDTLDNRRSVNLRIVTQSENAKNRRIKAS